MEFNDQLRYLANQAEAILFSTLAQRNKTSRETIQNLLTAAINTFKIYDINLRGWDKDIKEIVSQSLILADGIKLNDDDLLILKDAWAPELDDISFLQFLIDKYNLKLAVLTLGENGCILVDIQEVIHQKGIKINPRDPTGCGDAFAAALIHQYLRQKPLDEIASFSNLLGAYVVLFPGALPEYMLSDLSRFEKDYNS